MSDAPVIQSSVGRVGSRSQRSGFVLLLTLVVLALMVTGLATLARRAHRATVEADASVQRVQERWLVASAEGLLEHAVDLDGRIAAYRRTQAIYDGVDPTSTEHGPVVVTLAWQLDHDASSSSIAQDIESRVRHVRLTLADEQAKANLNALWGRTDPEVFRRRLETQFAELPRQGLRLEPRPFTELHRKALPVEETPARLRATSSLGSRPFAAKPEAANEQGWPTFGAFEQIFGLDDPASLQPASLGSGNWAQAIWEGSGGIGPPPAAPASAVGQSATLWGNGLLRVDRASEAAVRLQLQPLLTDTQIQAFLEARREDPLGSSPAALLAMDLTERQQELLQSRITDLSATYSVRLTIIDGDRRRDVLSVRDHPAESAESGSRLIRYRW